MYFIKWISQRIRDLRKGGLQAFRDVKRQMLLTPTEQKALALLFGIFVFGCLCKYVL